VSQIDFAIEGKQSAGTLDFILRAAPGSEGGRALSVLPCAWDVKGCTHKEQDGSIKDPGIVDGFGNGTVQV
jgi:hypothetical protein